ncbi:hypothetical protein GCM10012284_48930 [Mangrovihabitans endophyticus]|uniref:Uncharacterized protein n=2 Tax=Mangrovihabitans endophyticus TaxID=1751298 RepID=A0A8J3C4E9_9ACTN|nr:hypothetical protein GCM10012284_48930 [Mangrovihabitans endophyticus]
MTAAGIALIAGGLATLIGFRHVLWSRRGKRRRSAILPRPPRRRSGGVARRPKRARPTPPSKGLRDEAAHRARVAEERDASPERETPDRSAVDEAAPDVRAAESGNPEPALPGPAPSDPEPVGPESSGPELPGPELPGPESSGPAQSGPAFPDWPPLDLNSSPRRRHAAPADPAAEEETEAPPVNHRYVPRRRQSDVQNRSAVRDREGDRVEGWVRPQYRDQNETAAGDYWTPVPEHAYGWPTPVERLPDVPVPPSGFGADTAVVESEPTVTVPVWPSTGGPRRTELPRSWARAANVPSERAAHSDTRTTVPGAAGGTRRNDRAPWTPPRPAGQRRRPRPRPYPENPSTVYVSRHAADPP